MRVKAAASYAPVVAKGSIFFIAAFHLPLHTLARDYIVVAAAPLGGL